MSRSSQSVDSWNARAVFTLSTTCSSPAGIRIGNASAFILKRWSNSLNIVTGRAMAPKGVGLGSIPKRPRGARSETERRNDRTPLHPPPRRVASGRPGADGCGHPPHAAQAVRGGALHQLAVEAPPPPGPAGLEQVQAARLESLLVPLRAAPLARGPLRGRPGPAFARAAGHHRPGLGAGPLRPNVWTGLAGGCDGSGGLDRRAGGLENLPADFAGRQPCGQERAVRLPHRRVGRADARNADRLLLQIAKLLP